MSFYEKTYRFKCIGIHNIFCAAAAFQVTSNEIKTGEQLTTSMYFLDLGVKVVIHRPH